MITNTPRTRAVLAPLLAGLLALAACEEGQPNREPLRVRTRSGGTVDLSRTEWQACFPTGEGSQIWREVHGEEGAVTFVTTPYASADCTGAATGPQDSLGFLALAERDVQVGWQGDTPPSGLDATVTATGVLLFVSSGAWALDIYFVDDTRTPRVLYTGDSTSRPDPRQFPSRLLTVGEGEQP